MKPKIKTVFRIAVIVALLLGSLSLPGNVMPVRADAVATDPVVTNHDTTFDNIAPARGEFEQLPFNGQYVKGSDAPCPSGAIPGSDFAQWDLVGGTDTPVSLEGQVTSSKLAWDDNGIDHHSRDRNFFVYPDLNFAHLLAAPGNFHQGEENEHGRIEVEWESAAFPPWALPMMGDWVHVEGSHIWDCAHGENGYRTEIHPPRLVMTLRDAADQWSNGTATIPARPGWADTMPGLGSVPVPVTRADVFASSDGGEAREQETCFSPPFLPPPPGCPPDWYQPLNEKNYDLFVPAPPKPDPDAQLVTKLIHHPFPTCSSDNDCGSLDVWGSNPDPDLNRFTFTEVPAGVAIHVNFDGFTEPASLLYGFGFTLEVGWTRPAQVPPRRVKVSILGVHVSNPLDGKTAGSFNDGQIEMSSLIGDTFRHMRLTGNGVSYDYHQDVPDTEDVNVGDYGVQNGGSECALDTVNHDVDPGPCQTSFDVTLLSGEPLRIFFRAEEHDIAENDEAGSVERITTEAQNYGISATPYTEWFQERTSAGDDALDPDCGLPNPTPCLRITYKIEDDPIPGPPATTITAGAPVVALGGDTWVTSGSDLTLQATAPAGHEGDTLEIHEHFWRSGVQSPAESVCNSPGTTSCTLHLNANDGADGQYTVEYWTVDTTTGAIEPTQTATFQLDNTAPTSSASLAGTLVRGWYNTPVTVTLSASDGAGVGVDHTSYSVDGGFSFPYSTPFVVSGDKDAHSVLFFSADKLTNTEAFQTTSFKIDTTPPTLTVSNASDGTFSYTQDELVNGIFTDATVLNVSYTASDALSGLYEVRLDGLSSVSGTGTFAVPLPAGISTHTLEAEDVAGNLRDITFQVVSVPPGTFSGGVAPQGGGFWKNAVSSGAYSNADLANFLAETDVASQAFGPKLNRYADATLVNYLSYLSVSPNDIMDLKVRRELLSAWLNFMSGREPPKQSVDLKKVSDWQAVVKNTGGSSQTTALNLVREVERRLGESPSTTLLQTIQSLLEKLNTGNLNK
jgi:hypothetical protein